MQVPSARVLRLESHGGGTAAEKAGCGVTKFWDTGSVHGDEYYTRREDAEIITGNIIEMPLKVWMPFNDMDSEWHHVLKEHGFDVIATEGDFFATDPPGGGCNALSVIHLLVLTGK